MYNKKVVEKLIILAKKAQKKGEVPIAAIIIKDNKIISKAYNKRKSSNNPLFHAEIQCIIKAAKKTKDWRLNKCTLFTTIEPCHMCKEIIKECRIQHTYYLLENPKVINYKQSIKKIDSDLTNDYEKIIKDFFKNIRK